MIDLYVRDHHRWKSENKSKLAAQWIAEVKECSEYRNVWLTVKMTLEFLRVQERKFTKAIKRAIELNVQPPSHQDAMSAVDLDLGFDGLSGVPNSNKVEVQHLCRYYRRLFHTLAPCALIVSEGSSTETSPSTPSFFPSVSSASPQRHPIRQTIFASAHRLPRHVRQHQRRPLTQLRSIFEL